MDWIFLGQEGTPPTMQQSWHKIYDELQSKEVTVIAAIDLEDAYKRVDYERFVCKS